MNHNEPLANSGNRVRHNHKRWLDPWCRHPADIHWMPTGKECSVCGLRQWPHLDSEGTDWRDWRLFRVTGAWYCRRHYPELTSRLVEAVVERPADRPAYRIGRPRYHASRRMLRSMAEEAVRARLSLGERERLHAIELEGVPVGPDGVVIARVWTRKA